MKLVTMNADNQAVAEDCPVGKRQVESLGNHVLMPSAIWRHRKHRLQSVSIAWQGRPICEGGPGEDMDPEDALEHFMLEQSIIKDHKGNMQISRKWVRSLTAFLVLFGKMAIMVMGTFGVGLVLYVLFWVIPHAQ